MYVSDNFVDLSYEEVDKFHYHQFKVNPDQKDPEYPGGAGEGMKRDKFNITNDQIMRGWLLKTTRGQIIKEKCPKPRDPKDPDDNIPPGDDDDLYVRIFVKGHALKKELYCQWKPEVMFFCPMDEKNEIEGMVDKKSKIINPDSYIENRFVEGAKFYYFDERNKEWISKTFSEFQSIERLVRSDTGSTNDCNRRG